MTNFRNYQYSNRPWNQIYCNRTLTYCNRIGCIWRKMKIECIKILDMTNQFPVKSCPRASIVSLERWFIPEFVRKIFVGKFAFRNMSKCKKIQNFTKLPNCSSNRSDDILKRKTCSLREVPFPISAQSVEYWAR